LVFFALLRLAVVSAFTRATFFRCFFLVLRSFSRPVAIVSPNCKKWKRNEPLALALSGLYSTRLYTPQAENVSRFALRGHHSHAKMPRDSRTMLKNPAGISCVFGLSGLFGWKTRTRWTR